MSLEAIRKIWVMIGTVIIALNAAWIPDLVKGAFSPEGTEIVFTAVGAVLTAFQFFKSRTGEGKPQALHVKDSKSVTMYMLNPFASAA